MSRLTGKPATTCAGCLAWGVLGGRFCSTCNSFARFQTEDECGACRRIVAVKRGYCRLCWKQASTDAHGQAKHLQPFLERVRHQQLFFAGMRRIRQPLPRHPTGHGSAAGRDHTRRVDRSVAQPSRQPRLLDVAKDFTRFDAARDARPDNPWVIRARRATATIGDAHGWGRWTKFNVNQALMILLSGHCDGDRVRYSELFPVLRQHNLNVKRTIEVLDHLGVFDDDRTPTLDRWLSRRLAELAPGIRADVDAWAHVLVEGGPRTRARSRRTLQAYLDHIQPVLTNWSRGYEQLREVTRDDVVAARDALHGAKRETTIVALRSLFQFCKRTGRVFRDPTVRVQTGRRTRRVPLPLQPDEISMAVAAAATSADRVVLALAGIHAARPHDICHLLLDDIDIPNRRLAIGGQVRPLDEPTRLTVLRWLEERRQRWPNTANPHLLVNAHTALGLRPVGHASITKAVRGLTAGVERLRVDRQLDEALTTGADPLHLAAVFGIEEGTAIRYANAARQLLITAAEQHDPEFASNTTGDDGKMADQPSGSR